MGTAFFVVFVIHNFRYARPCVCTQRGCPVEPHRRGALNRIK
jgi:hypothetical protein